MSADGPLHPRWSALAHAAAFFYGLGVQAHRAWWRVRSPADLGVPVVSVGNVSAGGTGKTPFVRWTCGALSELGRHPAVAMRGYAAKGGASDEADEYRESMPGVPLAVGADRVAAVAAVRGAHPEVDCVVLDDGFQHRAVARALDIVLVDASRPAIGGALLPAGWLREPGSALRRAGLVVVTRASREDPALASRIEALHGAPPAAWTRHAWLRIERFGAGGRDMPLSSVDGTRFVCATALGNPAAFIAEVESRGGRVRSDLRFPDHHAFTRADAESIASEARRHDAAVLCTGKDWVKLRHLVGEPAGVEWLVVRAGIEFLAGESCVRDALRRAVPGA
jgi:tetraacyldisaccharide 4'-kinase